jgi:hypothetical protein
MEHTEDNISLKTDIPANNLTLRLVDEKISFIKSAGRYVYICSVAFEAAGKEITTTHGIRLVGEHITLPSIRSAHKWFPASSVPISIYKSLVKLVESSAKYQKGVREGILSPIGPVEEHPAYHKVFHSEDRAA